MSGSVPVTILTGFLGSGKTTLLRQLLQAEEGARAAVLINEFGEIGLDHLLARSIEGPTVVLQNGCICCSVRSDLRSGLRDLIDARDRNEVPEFDRILVETTGLADPLPIVQTLALDPMLRSQVRLAQLVSTVDAVNGLQSLQRAREARRQAGVADRLVVTKSDIVDPGQTAELRAALRAINPAALILDPHEAIDLWSALVANEAHHPNRSEEEITAWLGAVEAAPGPSPAHNEAAGDAESVSSLSYSTERPIDWTAFAVWLSALVHRHGSRILRIKGLLHVAGLSGPVLLNAVQSFVHPPMHLLDWPTQDRSSRLVFITQGLDQGALRRSLDGLVEQTASAELPMPSVSRFQAV